MTIDDSKIIPLKQVAVKYLTGAQLAPFSSHLALKFYRELFW